MRPARSRLARLLICLLLAQWAAALVPQVRALAAFGSAQAVEICSHEGVRILLLDDQGQPVEPEQAIGCCMLCQGPATITASGPAQPAQRVTYVLDARQPREAGLPVAPPRAPPQQPRAPPQI